MEPTDSGTGRMLVSVLLMCIAAVGGGWLLRALSGPISGMVLLMLIVALGATLAGHARAGLGLLTGAAVVLLGAAMWSSRSRADRTRD